MHWCMTTVCNQWHDVVFKGGYDGLWYWRTCIIFWLSPPMPSVFPRNAAVHCPCSVLFVRQMGELRKHVS